MQDIDVTSVKLAGHKPRLNLPNAFNNGYVNRTKCAHGVTTNCVFCDVPISIEDIKYLFEGVAQEAPAW